MTKKTEIKPKEFSSSKVQFRLLCSLDIIGSTAFKAEPSNDPKAYPEKKQKIHDLYSNFYNQIILELRAELQKEKHYVEPNIWKYVGDEILLYFDLNKFGKELPIIIEALKDVSNNFRSKVLKDYKKLDLKMTLWTAGFPYLNDTVYLSLGNQRVIDFIGPSIDIGFRLTKFSTAFRSPISVELAYLLARYECGIEIYFETLVSLKGVLAGSDYPLFWIDFTNTNEEKLADLIKLERDLLSTKCKKNEDVLNYTKRYIDNKAYPLALPFSESDPNNRRLLYGRGDENLNNLLSIDSFSPDAQEELSKDTETAQLTKNEMIKRLKITKK